MIPRAKEGCLNLFSAIGVKSGILKPFFFLKPLANPALITDVSLTFFQLFRSSSLVRLLGRTRAGMLGCVWVLAALPFPGSLWFCGIHASLFHLHLGIFLVKVKS